MLNLIQYGNTLRIWWKYNFLENNSSYLITINDKKYRTKKTFITLRNLVAGEKLSIALYLCSSRKRKFIAQTETVMPEKKNIIDVTSAIYGAVGDGIIDNTSAIQKAINDCTKDCEVFFPDGVYSTGALDLRSGVTLHLSENAVIKGSIKAVDYLPKVDSRFEGVMCKCYRSLINCGKADSLKGCAEKNIVIYGGTIEGGGKELIEDVLSLERISIIKEYGLENQKAPSSFYYKVLPGRARGRLVQISNTDNILIADCTLKNSPAWTNHFIFCKNVTICGCKILSSGIWNGDGIDPDSCTNCTFFDLVFKTGDDNIAIKSGKNAEGYKIGRPCENINIFNCKSYGGHGLAIGSEMSGGVRSVDVWDCDFTTTTRGIHIKSSRGRGGYVKDVSVNNCKLSAVCVIMDYADNNDGQHAPVPPIYENFYFSNLTLNGVINIVDDGRKKNTPFIYLSGLEDSKIKNLVVKNVTLKGVPSVFSRKVQAANVENVKFIGLVNDEIK